MAVIGRVLTQSLSRLDISNLTRPQQSLVPMTGQANGSSAFDMTISVAVSCAVAGVLLLIIITAIIVYHVKKCQQKRRRFKRPVISNGSALGGSHSILVGTKPGYNQFPYQHDVTSGGGSTGSDLVSDSKSDSSAGSPNGSNPNRTSVFGISSGMYDQWQSPNNLTSYAASSATTVTGQCPPSLSLNPMPVPGQFDQTQMSYPASISMFPHASSTPGKPYSFLGAANSQHDIMTSSFPPPPPQAHIDILTQLTMEQQQVAQMQQPPPQNLSTSRSESLV